MGAWSETLLSKGMVLRIEFTVMGARWRKNDTLASPFPATLATHSIFDTEPAAGGGEDIDEALRLDPFSVFANHEIKTYEAFSAGELISEAP